MTADPGAPVKLNVKTIITIAVVAALTNVALGHLSTARAAK